MNWDPVTEKSERRLCAIWASEFVCVCGKSTVGPKGSHFFGVRFSHENPQKMNYIKCGGGVMSNR